MGGIPDLKFRPRSQKLIQPDGLHVLMGLEDVMVTCVLEVSGIISEKSVVL